MTYIKWLLMLLVLPLFAFTVIHKYYISVTQIDYLQNKQSVQVTTRIFIDDFEKLLRERYDETITLAGKNEPTTADLYIERYLKEKIKIKINNKEANLSFIGKEYDVDIVKCYLEIEGVKKIESFEISNEVLFDLYSEQQNIIKTKIHAQQKSVILIPQNKSALLKFN
ncbi:DUF6702 family protein [Mariniflexile litorale]|uniref:DUF6702 family protein n=1 Tax=Mariniflexile litorale TaxID=3045158 RepID=A0AAU7EHN9_9FLAO|nr:DUF6702 family protein [Mariniflexile sp. KMM 9835]MDQ8210137.1 peptidase E [Mariniflexile sp. KMM 9835]